MSICELSENKTSNGRKANGPWARGARHVRRSRAYHKPLTGKLFLLRQTGGTSVLSVYWAYSYHYAGSYRRLQALTWALVGGLNWCMATGMQDRIREKLARGLQPSSLDIVNDSNRHAGHMGDDGSGESHFTVEIVSPLFSGQTRVGRQRLVNAALADLLAEKVHALAIKARAPGEAP